MGTLNIVNKSPYEKLTLDQCLRRIGAGDSLLLIEDAAISALAGTTQEDSLVKASEHVKVYVLQPDLEARGFSDATLATPIERVDYSGFVDLVANHERVHSWL